MENENEPLKIVETTEDDGPGRAEQVTFRTVLDTVIWVICVIIVCLVIIKFVAYRCIVVGSSMSPTLESGNNLIVEKVSYYFHDPERFDIVILDKVENYDKETHLIKRVIGLPGETVSISDGKVYINGQVLEDDTYAASGYTSAMEPITLGADEYFVLGDNRDHSSDSRVFGPVKKENIEGKAVLRFWPLSGFGLLGD